MLSFRIWLLLGLAFLPCFLGGGWTEAEAGWIVAAVGLYMAVFPPARWPSRPLALGMGLLLVTPFFSFLPLAHGSLLAGAWRSQLESGGHIDLGNLVTPQPWMSADAAVFFLCGWVFLAVRLAEQPEEEDRLELSTIFSLACATMAVLALVQHFLGGFLPWWNQAIHTSFGPFPNRNEFGNLLALGGICSLVGALQRLHQSPLRMTLHYTALVLIFVALICNGSRGGMALFFGGGLLWLVWISIQSRSLRFGGRITAIIMAFLALFLAFGGTLVERVLSMRLSGAVMEADFRMLMARDVFWMIRHIPLFGIGIGNFEPIFAMFRRFSENGMTVLHPDSDLMWALGECGFIGLIVFLAGLILGAGAWFPVRRGSARSLHAGAIIASLSFLIHGAFEVPMHRLGSLLPGLFLLGSALASPGKPSMVPKGPKVIPHFIFWGGARYFLRLLGGALVVVGALWVMPGGGKFWPPRAAAEAKERAIAERDAKDYLRSDEDATRALAVRPLDWRLYYLRGESRYAGKRDFDAAAADFLVARSLQPARSDIRLREATLWYPVRPFYGLSIEAEALKLSPGADRAKIYDNIVENTYSNVFLRPALLNMAGDNFSLQLVYFSHAEREDAAIVLQRLMAVDSELRFINAAQLGQILQRWATIGNLPDLVARIEASASWEAAGWTIAAKYYAESGNPRKAYQMARKRDPLPPFPKMDPTDSKEQLSLDAKLNPNAIKPRIYLLQIARNSNDSVSASRLLQQLVRLDGCPGYLYYYMAEDRAGAGDWAGAWSWYQRYHPLP
ncbi:O-antigen ligase [Verrucomicrobium sp. GAS474]|uniref:O-antigen ligase family protein n=1 Tax=Verrucomicrobium sp. GAS474 TaxID=1882831 RepID=UPI00087D5DE9|nr:O-antigen ligase family protein [Verrucomicrobium sp. GAS474]SDU07209.1 O-antigen ligase [Verrucomicrobium sp. GAS474]